MIAIWWMLFLVTLFLVVGKVWKALPSDARCVDCKWNGRNHPAGGNVYPSERCYAPQLGTDPVRGGPKPRHCSTAREFFGPATLCGPAASWFESAEDIRENGT